MTDPQHQPAIPLAPDRGGTLAHQLARSKNRPAGFDYMRIVLAAGVIVMHTINTSYGQRAAVAFWSTPARLAVGPILPMFFVLSGFLVAGSLARCRTLVSFLGLRAIRIMPALAVEVLISALILGPLLTTLPLADYLSSPMFHSYFLNIIGEIHFRLPGVFAENPVPLTVNGQLWTVPFELKCYAVLALLALVGIASRRYWLLATLVLAQVLLVTYARFGNPPPSTTVPGEVMVFCFLCGIALFAWRDRVPWSPALFALAVAVSGVLLLVEGGDWVVGLPMAYVTVFLGLLSPPRCRTLLSGDYSYGIFLYGYPIQQMVASFGPELRHWWINLAIALPAAIVVAVVSWWCVEKPALQLKNSLVAFENWLLQRMPRLIPTLTKAPATR